MRNPKPLPPSPTPPTKVSAKEAHRRIRELTEAVSRGHRVRQETRTETPPATPSPNLSPIPEP